MKEIKLKQKIVSTCFSDKLNKKKGFFFLMVFIVKCETIIRESSH